MMTRHERTMGIWEGVRYKEWEERWEGEQVKDRRMQEKRGQGLI